MDWEIIQSPDITNRGINNSAKIYRVRSGYVTGGNREVILLETASAQVVSSSTVTNTGRSHRDRNRL